MLILTSLASANLILLKSKALHTADRKFSLFCLVKFGAGPIFFSLFLPFFFFNHL